MKQVTYVYELTENGSDKVSEHANEEKAQTWIDEQPLSKSFYQMTWQLTE